MLRLVSKQKRIVSLKSQLTASAAVVNTNNRSFTSSNNNSTTTRNIATPFNAQINTKSTLLNQIDRSSTIKRYYAAKPVEITMPALSPSMETGNIAKWVKKEGDQIKQGDILAQIETDKATMDFEYEDNGYLAKILLPDGSKGIAINTPIAILVKNKEDIASAKEYKVGAPATEAPKAAPAAEAPKAAQPASKPKSTKTYPPHKVVGMPALSPSMETGTIAGWSKKVGDQIKQGDILAQIETDKATMDFEYEDNGYLAKILVPTKTSGIAINQPICVLANKKEDVDKFADFSVEQESAAEAPAAAQETSATTAAAPSQSTGAPAATQQSGSRIFASPAAKVAAASKGFDLSAIAGTGPNSRILKADVLEFTPSTKPSAATGAPAAAKPTVATPGSSAAYTDIPHTNVRKVTASRLTQSKQTIPHYYLTMECRVDKMMKVRKELNAQLKYSISLNDFIIKAAAAALRDNPTVNSTWMDDAIRRYHNVDINVAVNTEHGLFTPIIRDADKRGLGSIALGVKELAAKAQNKQLTPAEFETGTFTISNLGMFGIKTFSAVINPPQAAILAVGTTEQRLVPSTNPDSPFETATILSVTLSCDHRVVDGAVGAEWLKSFKSYVEDPLKLLL
ncbi:hypothetical protein CYY_000135 [Polysphondylium violaceum]|uniref:Acetyltransferase component of pyruvate dehydrogenase complex n=1 Tax=Polysphondylium violaceum TaxID=133409 RepID=A0A8J4V2M5_9MYCE|nr:hypothetical protein CYY_000135 [Polysphondylium violaceum]